MNTANATLTPDGLGVCPLVVPDGLDRQIGTGPRLSEVTSGWECPLCACHSLCTEPVSVTMVCSLDYVDGKPVHRVESVHDRYGDAVDAKYDALMGRPKSDGVFRLIRSAYECGHTV